ncbi:hypothetical protein H6F67_03415 [Microcoleus sp. FACHB-1515]|uniref:hypothetical protein n=1 Tax=Cyanophyceae TaxID=3028117 RepID=UPI0016867BC0|nr:hypothetical protein [Microcoleus sp. FACHB-1515]MBD2088899.1 hypothetical protein [Microcoleus sp. FACHB-1515]
MDIECIHQWLSLQQQQAYINTLLGRVGMTRRRAECFLSLWLYLLAKQKSHSSPLAKLEVPAGLISCTHREAAELFYGNQDRGSDRAAGLMLDKLAALGLIDKQFDGNTICIQINPPPELLMLPAPAVTISLAPDQFNARTDTIPVATFLAQNYNWRCKTTVVPHKIAKLLRQWSAQYAIGLRVLRRQDNGNPIGFYAFYPTAAESEENFFLPPRKSLHLSSSAIEDPIKMAAAGDSTCTTIFVRSWMIDATYLQPSTLCQFLQDAQTTIQRMQLDFPNLCDLQTLIIHPAYEKLAIALGFQKTSQDPQVFISWMYLAIDRFLALNIPEAVAQLEFERFEK